MSNTKATEVIVVWGASGGVGRHLVETLCGMGKSVIAYARQPESLQDLADQYPKLHIRQFEISESFYRQEKIKLQADDVRIVGMVDCVGSITAAPGAALTDRFDELLKPNLLHAYLSTQLFSELFTDNASIVFLSSIRAKTGTDNDNIEYAFAKAAVENLSLSLTQRFKERRIRCNVVRPTPILGTNFSKDWPKKLVDDLTDKSIYSELLTPQDVVSVVMFLLSEESRGITGSTIDVTNGFQA